MMSTLSRRRCPTSSKSCARSRRSRWAAPPDPSPWPTSCKELPADSSHQSGSTRMTDPTRPSSESVSRGRFDMIVTFTDEMQARQALGELRSAGFGPDQALLLQPEDDTSNLIAPEGQIRLPQTELVADRAVAI